MHYFLDFPATNWPDLSISVRCATILLGKNARFFSGKGSFTPKRKFWIFGATLFAAAGVTSACAIDYKYEVFWLFG